MTRASKRLAGWLALSPASSPRFAGQLIVTDSTTQWIGTTSCVREIGCALFGCDDEIKKKKNKLLVHNLFKSTAQQRILGIHATCTVHVSVLYLEKNAIYLMMIYFRWTVGLGWWCLSDIAD